MKNKAEEIEWIKKTHTGLVKAKLIESGKLVADFPGLVKQFQTAVESIDADKNVKGESIIASYNAAFDCYEHLGDTYPDGVTETEEAVEEEVVGDVEAEETEPEEDGVEPEVVDPPAKAKTKAPTKPKAAAKPKAAKPKAAAKTKAPPKEKAAAPPKAKTKAAPKNKKPGVVDIIFRELKKARKATPITKKEIHAVLVEELPERVADKMMVSVNTIVTPKEIERLRGLVLKVIKDERPWKYYLGK